MPAWMLAGHDGILAVDIGGTNIRAGVVELASTRRRTCRRPRSGSRTSGAMPTTSRIARTGRGAACRMLKSSSPRRATRQAAPRPGDRHRLPRHHRGGRLDRARRPEPAGRQLGIEPLQPGGQPDRGDPRDRRPRDLRHHAQRRGGAGPEPGAVRPGRRALGRRDHRHGPRQCALHQQSARRKKAT